MMGKHEILVVEDNPADVTLLRYCFQKESTCHFTIAVDGEQALDYVHRRKTFSERLKPDVIILDLNLPKRDGKEVLAQIRTHSEFEKIPVLMLSGSSNPDDKTACLALGANQYLIKPEGIDGLHTICGAVKELLEIPRTC